MRPSLRPLDETAWPDRGLDYRALFLRGGQTHSYPLINSDLDCVASTPAIETSEPNFRKGSIAAIRP